MMQGYPKVDIAPPAKGASRTRTGMHGEYRWRVTIYQRAGDLMTTIRVDVETDHCTRIHRYWHAVPNGVGKPRKRLWGESSRKAQDAVRNMIRDMEKNR